MNNYEHWLEDVIRILKIRLSNYNINTEELITLIEYVYEDIFRNINLIKRRFEYQVNNQATIDLAKRIKDEDIVVTNIVGLYNCKGDAISYNYENYSCNFDIDFLNNCKFVIVYASIMPKIDRCQYDVLLDIKRAIIEGVVEQMRLTVQNQRNQQVTTQAYSIYNEELYRLKEKYDEFVWNQIQG